MSVRKTAAPAGTVVGLQVVKTLGFWIAMAIFSFVVGLFILSPMINVVRGTQAGPAVNSATSGDPSPPGPSSQRQERGSVAAPSESRGRDRGVDSDVQITTDRDSRHTVQTPERVDDSVSRRDDSASRTDTNTDGTADSTNRNPYRRDSNADRADRTDAQRDADAPQPASSLDHPSTDDRAQRSDADRTDRSTDPPADPPAPSTRRHRRPRRQPDDSNPPRGAADSSAGGVQHGESIDR
jgi:hypothetical protein